MTHDSPAGSSPIDLTMGQAALWFGQTLDPANPTFNVCDAVELAGEVDVEALTRAAHLAVTESDALTTRFIDADEGVRQVPGAWLLAPPALTTLAEADDPWPQLHRHIRTWTAQPHDLTAEPGVQHWILQHGDRTFWVLAAHHALIDAYGLSLVFSRGAEIYRRLRAGESDPGRPLGSIRDVVAQDLEYLGSDKFRADAEFWADRLAEAARSSSGSEAAQARSVRTARTSIGPFTGPSASPSTELRTSNWAAAVTAGVAAYLARRTGDRRQTLGFLLMNRLGLAAARVPTSSVNLAPLTVPTGPADSVQQIIGATEAAMRPMSAHQRHRGETIGGDTLTAGFARHIGTVVNVKPFATTLDFGGLSAVVHSVDRGPVQDYSVTVAIGADGRPEVILDADAHLYDDAALHALLADLAAFLESFTAPEAAERRLASFGLLTATQCAEVFALGDGGENPEGAVTTLAMFDATAAARPDDVALVAHDATLTYAQLAERSRRIGAVLAAHGVGPESFVAIVAESSAAAVAAIHATWRAGGAYVPVDPKYPADRIAHQLTDCAPRVVLTTEQSHEAVAELLPADAVILDLDGIADDAPAELQAPSGPASSYPAPDAAAYVIYTSGSTGLPKGVVVSHRNLATLLGSHRHHTMTGPRQRVLSTHTLSFDSSVSYMAWMTVGHTLHLIDRADVTTADLVVDYVRAHRIDFIDAVPVLMDAYVRAGIVDPAPGRHVPQCLSTGGEAFPPHLWAELADHRDVTVFNLYGPTEGTVDSTFARVADTPAPSIGRPALGGALYVLDRHLHPVAEGETGELYVAGPQLARGYHRRPSMTAQRFVANPFPGGSRLYRTGDLVRWNRFGGLDYLGRSDDQVQIAGYRVEYGEVEALVARAAERIGLAVDQVVADVRTSRHGVRRLVGYVARSGDGSDADFGGLRDAVADLAPAHLVPALFVPVERVPLSPAGKTDRAALPDPWSQRSAAPAAAGGSPVEMLCGIFGDLLDVDDVGPGDDFFGLGGDSIVAIGVTSRARALGLTVTPRQVFELRTARALAAEAVDDGPATAPTDPARAYGEVPPTPLMRRVLRGGQVDGFAQVRVLRVPVGAAPESLGEALIATAAAHPMLTATLDDTGLHVPEPTAAPVALDVVSLTGGADAAAAQAQITALARSAARHLDPAHGPLLRAVLVRGLPAENRADALIVVVHHLAVDGVSWRILTEDLRTAYAQVCAARATRLAAEGTSFREWAQTLCERAASTEIAATAPQWEHPGTTSGEIAVAARPLDPAVDTADRVERREIDVRAEQVVSTLPSLYNTGPTEVLLATLSVAVASVFGRPGAFPEPSRRDRRIFVDVEGHGRDETLAAGSDLSRTVGWFTAFWPVPIDVPPCREPTSVEAVDAVIKQVKERLARPLYSGLEYGLLSELRPDSRPRAASPVLFNYLGRLTTGEGAETFSALWPSRPLLVVRDDRMPVSHPLEINAITVPTAAGAVLRAEISWVSTLIGAEQVQAIVEAWTQILTMLDADAAHDGLGGATPSDSLVADLTQDEIDEFAGEFA